MNIIAECTLPEKILLAAHQLEATGQSPFSAEALVNVLAAIGVKTVRTLGVDGGVAYSRAFHDLNGTTRLAVRLHRRVCLVLTEDAVLAEELLARKKLAQDVAGRLSDRALLVRPGRVEAVVEELRRMGHTPRVVGRAADGP